MSPQLSGISSMATRRVLAELADAYRRSTGVRLSIESVGGTDAARRVQAGEVFDAVFLAADVIERLVASGHVLAGSRADLFRSEVAIAVRRGAARPDVATEAALKRAVLAARAIGYSTGPSGAALAALFERWGIAGQLRGRIVVPPPGMPVAALVARGDVELGFQQASEMLGVEGIDVLGRMPPGATITTVFAGGVTAVSRQPDAVRALLQFMRSPAADETKRRHGMAPA